MKEFKDALRKRIIIASTIFTGFLVIFVVLLTHYRSAINHLENFISGYQVGGVLGLSLFALFNIVRYSIALCNESFLKKLYINETDERNRLIFEKSGSLGMNIVMFSLLAAAIVAGFYDVTVTITLMAAILVIGIIRLGLKLYYGGKY